MNYVRLSNLSLKYQKFTRTVYKDIGMRKFEFVTKTQFLLSFFTLILRFFRERKTDTQGTIMNKKRAKYL